jgi:hypothetical protein
MEMNSAESERRGNNALINTCSEESHELISEEHDNELEGGELSIALMAEDSDEENENNEIMSEEDTEDVPVNEDRPKTEEDLLLALDALERVLTSRMTINAIDSFYTDTRTCIITENATAM